MEVVFERFTETQRKHGDATVAALAIAHDNLGLSKINVFDPQG
jgi:hypothetical protein